jgi:hypothetical protein
MYNKKEVKHEYELPLKLKWYINFFILFW